MDKLKHLTTPLLLFAVLLIVVPAMELADAVWPVGLGNAEWRFGAVGLLSNTLLEPLLGSAIIIVVATLSDKRRILVNMSVINGLAALLLFVAIPLFMLDSIELRSRVPPEATLRFDVAASKAVFVHGLAVIVLAGLSFAGLKSSKRLDRHSKDRSKGESPKMVHEPS